MKQKLKVGDVIMVLPHKDIITSHTEGKIGIVIGWAFGFVPMVQVGIDVVTKELIDNDKRVFTYIFHADNCLFKIGTL